MTGLVDAPPVGRRWGATFARAAGVTGLLANGLLVAFFALLAADFPAQEVAGPANDLVGSAATALMVPVVGALRPLLPRRRSVSAAQAVGVTAMGVLAAIGPLLVTGVVPFEIATPISITAYMLLAGWLLLVNRWMRRAGTLDLFLTRCGQVLGAATLAGFAACGLGLALLPSASPAQITLLVVGGVPGVLAWLATPVWFLLLGGRLAALPTPVPPTSPIEEES